MKLGILIITCMFSVSALSAQTPKTDFIFTEAYDLNLIGKILDDTPNPYHRVDTVRYKGFTDDGQPQVRQNRRMEVTIWF